jgi:hypothetical protein
MMISTPSRSASEWRVAARSYISPVALSAVILTMLGLTLAVYDAYARGAFDPPRSVPQPVSLEPAFVVASQPVPVVLSDADQLIAAVRRANDAFIAARFQGNAAPLEAAATGPWLAQEQAYIAAMRSRFQTERWTMNSMEVVRAEVLPDGTGFVCTRERWDGAVIRTDGSTASARGYTLNEGYYLSRVGGEWRVFRVEFS